MRHKHPALLIALALASSLTVLADEQYPRGTLIRIHSVSEGEAPHGAFKSQTLTEFRLLENMARQDVYMGGIKGNPQMHQTTLYIPAENKVIRILHGSRTYISAGPKQLEEEKRTLRDIIQKQGGIPTPRPTMTETDEVDTVDGYTTRKFTADTLNGVITYWIVDDDSLEEAMKLLGQLTSTPVGEMGMLRFPDPASIDGAPIKMVIEAMIQGIRTTTTSLHSFEFNVVFEADAFVVPAGYELVDKPPMAGLPVPH